MLATTPIMENRMKKKMENDMETATWRVTRIIRAIESKLPTGGFYGGLDRGVVCGL